MFGRRSFIPLEPTDQFRAGDTPPFPQPNIMPEAALSIPVLVQKYKEGVKSPDQQQDKDEHRYKEPERAAFFDGTIGRREHFTGQVWLRKHSKRTARKQAEISCSGSAWCRIKTQPETANIGFCPGMGIGTPDKTPPLRIQLCTKALDKPGRYAKMPENDHKGTGKMETIAFFFFKEEAFQRQ